MEEQFEYEIESTNETDQLFNDTKKGIIEIMEEDTNSKVEAYEFAGYKFKFDVDEIKKMLDITQKINFGFIEEVKVLDIDGNEIIMNKNEYVQRNLYAFANKTACNIQLDEIKEKVNEMESFLDFAPLENLESAIENLDVTEYPNKYKYVPKEPDPLPDEEIIEPAIDPFIEG